MFVWQLERSTALALHAIDEVLGPLEHDTRIERLRFIARWFDHSADRRTHDMPANLAFRGASYAHQSLGLEGERERGHARDAELDGLVLERIDSEPHVRIGGVG